MFQQFLPDLLPPQDNPCRVNLPTFNININCIYLNIYSIQYTPYYVYGWYLSLYSTVMGPPKRL